MTTLVDLMQRGTPTTVDVVGKRLSGTVAVSFSRSSKLTPVITFGGDRFGLHTSVVTANGIEVEVAACSFYRNDDGSWSKDGYYGVRRNIQYQSGPLDYEVPGKTARLVYDALQAMCPALYERHRDAFVMLGRRTKWDGDQVPYGKTLQRLREDLRIVGEVAGLETMIADGYAIVVPRIGDRLPERIRWETPSRDAISDDVFQRGRGNVVGAIVLAENAGGLLGYAVDRDEYPGKTECYYGPLLIPIEIARSDERSR